MKRDFDLVRKLLIFFEEKPGPERVEVPPIEGYDDLTIKYHLVLLYEAGFLRCEPVKSSTSDRIIYVLPFDLTWQGHEFLDKIRSDSTWQKVKDTILSKGGALAFNIISEVATKSQWKGSWDPRHEEHRESARLNLHLRRIGGNPGDTCHNLPRSSLE